MPLFTWLFGSDDGQASAADQAVTTQDEAHHVQARELFQKNCASCHGETGDGDGWVELDRPARSFREGGFSFGNTPEALFRTLSTGIPGTPMPGFDSSLNADELRLLADYVVTLGPEITAVEASDTELVVSERPRIVRGLLPPIAEGCVEQARGLLIGTTDGLSFEYRTDDVRLLGVRQGAFVERTDWIGRGGTALAPLGRVVHLVRSGNPRPTFEHANGAFSARMRGTWIRAERAGVRYALRHGGKEQALVEESARSVSFSAGTGYAREFRVRAGDVAFEGQLVVESDGYASEKVEPAPPKPEASAAGTRAWTVFRREDGFTVCLGIESTGSPATFDAGRGRVPLRLTPGATQRVEARVLVLPEWSAAIAEQLEAEWPR